MLLIQINAEYFTGSHISTRLQYNWLMMNKPMQVDCRVRLADLEPPFGFRIIDKGLSSLTCQIVPSPWLVITEILEMLQKIQS